MDGDFLRRDASEFLSSTLPREPMLERLERLAQDEGQPAVNPASGALLRMLVAATGGRRALEVGTNLGYGALWMARGLAPDGLLDTIEIDPRMCERARAHLAEAGLAGRVRVHEGAALDVLQRLPDGAYDIVFLDCVKSEYPQYLDHARRLLRPGGIVAADNVFWHAHMWDPAARDADTLGLREYLCRVTTDPAWATSVVPTGDGVAVSVLVGKA